MASIDDFVLLDTVDMPLRHRVNDAVLLMDDGTEMFIRVSNTDSGEFRRLKAKYRNEQLRNPGKGQTAEKEDSRLTELLVVSTHGWALQGADGPIPFSQKAARALYSDPKYRWIRDQVTVAIFDDATFAGESLAA